MEEFFKLVSNFGFPIALSVYLLFRFEKILSDLSKMVDKMSNDVVNLKDSIENTIDEMKYGRKRK